QGDRATNVMQAPKVTVFNGQAANINVGDEKLCLANVETQRDGVTTAGQELMDLGFSAKLLPVVSADGKFVRLHLDVNSTTLDQVHPAPHVSKLTLDKVVV